MLRPGILFHPPYNYEVCRHVLLYVRPCLKTNFPYLILSLSLNSFLGFLDLKLYGISIDFRFDPIDIPFPCNSILNNLAYN